MSLQPGQVLNNRYRIDGLLGQGGFGAVYLAWDLNLSAPVAVKENLDTSPASQKQFRSEAQLLFKLHHANLPRVHDCFVIPEQGIYLTMDYIEGEDLDQRLRRAGGPIPEDQALEWIDQVCGALIYLHSQEPPIIHRDIKPANIRINPRGQAILVDFGIAKVFNPSTVTTVGARAVTPGYSSPEQYGRGETDARSDIYSLAATLYTLLTAKVPSDSLDLITASAPPLDPIDRVIPSITPAISQAVSLGMALTKTNRFPTVEEFRAALRKPDIKIAQVEAPVIVSPPPPADKSTIVISPALDFVEPTVKVEPPAGHFKRTVKASPPSVPGKGKFPKWLWGVAGGITFLCIITIASMIVWPLLNGSPTRQAAPTTASSPSEVEVAPTAVRPTAQDLTTPDTSALIGNPVIKVGGIAELTGYAIPEVGIAFKNAAEMAVKEINDAGGLEVGGKRYQIQLVLKDNRGEAEQSAFAAQDLISQDQVLAIIGPNASRLANPASEVAESSKVVLIAPWSTNRLTTLNEVDGTPKRYVFRVPVVDAYQGGAMAKFAIDRLGAKTSAVLYDAAVEYNKGNADVFIKTFEEHDGLVTLETYKSGDQDYTSQLTRIRDAKPDVIFLPNHYDVVSAQVRQAHQLGINAIFLGSNSWGFSELPDLCVGECEGYFFSTHYAADNTAPVSMAFVDRYKRAYGAVPDDVAALTYDAFGLLWQALKTAGRVDRQAVRDALANLSAYEGVTGKIQYKDGSGDPIKSVAILWIRDRAFVFYANAYP